MTDIINPDRVFKAAIYLKNQELYKSFKVTTDLSWYESHNDSLMEVDRMVNELEQDQDDEMEDVNPGSRHTLITSNFHTAQPMTQDQGLSLAPGENRVPLSLIYDQCGEELAFPTIYCGKARYIETKHTYTDIASSEIRRSDRRAVRPDHLLYMYSKIRHCRLMNAMAIALRKKKHLDNHLTAQDMLDPSIIEGLVNHNDGYKFLTHVKGTPPYWETEKNRVLAAIRQFGLPTLFVTVSAAETHWPELLACLHKNIHGRDISLEEAENLSYDQKCELIQKDPVTCALYFDHKFRELVKTWKLESGPFGSHSIEHSYHRIEFQHRGSPHAHMLLWLKDAPLFEPEDPKPCEQFISQLATCNKNHIYYTYQIHKHSFTCRKKSEKGNEYCRFNIPFFPMDRTRILVPFPEGEPRKHTKADFNELRDYIDTLATDSTMTFDQFLESAHLTLGTYINIIRSGIQRPTVFHKRNVCDIMTNAYNPKILALMRSNMDIQFILNAYACVTYMNNYINKSQRGMSKLLRACVEEARAGGLDLRGSMRKISNVLLNASEICAQEAAWSILELPMARLSEADIFIPTFPPRDRARIVKCKEKLSSLNPQSKDIFESSLIDKYVQRPQSLETMCLADFAACHEFYNGVMRVRRKAKVIRYCGYKKEINSYEYYRENIMLYKHWRDEKLDILDHDVEQLFNYNLNVIVENRAKYVVNEVDMDNILVEEEEEEEEDLVSSREAEMILDYDYDELKADISRDIDEYTGKEFEIFKIPRRLEESSYRNMMRAVNRAQHAILKHIMHFAFRDELFHIFITGPAGCGKSFTINALDETLGRLYEERGKDPSYLTVLKVAPTGKAAYNIKGVTIHSAFGIPTQKKELQQLNANSLNEYRSKFLHLKVLIIDEISMVGFKAFQKIDQRLRQIKNVDQPFGNVSVIALGDFRQLPPVAESPVYKMSEDSGIATLAGNILWEKFKIFELDEIMRQKDDVPFARALNNLANGTLTPTDICLFESRVVQEIQTRAIHLYPSNNQVDQHNAATILKHDGELIIAEAIDTVTGIGSRSAKSRLLRKVNSWERKKTANMDRNLKLKIGIKYMLVYNVATHDGLVNGAVGTLQHIEFCPVKNSRERAVKRLWFHFDDESVGRTARNNCVAYKIKNKIDSLYTPVNRLAKQIHAQQTSGLTIIRNQFPVQIAEAITIHKSQGATYEQVVANCKEKVTRNMLYVALSRATAAKGLYISGQFTPPLPPKEDDPVTCEMKRMREECPLLPVYQFLLEEFLGLQFMYHNIQSLHAHYEDLLKDPCFRTSDFIFLVETWSLPEDKYEIPGFSEISRIDSNLQVRKPKGIITYCKRRLADYVRNTIVYNKNNVQILILHIHDTIRFVIVYSPPRNSYENLLHSLTEAIEMDNMDMITILVGDFNINLNSPQGERLRNDLLNLNLFIQTKMDHFTTRGRTTIDAIFADINILSGVYTSFYSYHLPLYGRITPNSNIV